MPRKRKRQSARKRTTKKKKTTKRLTARDKKITKLIVDSVWRVATDDTDFTASGKEVSSGWKRCRILERLCETKEYPEGAVKVQYVDDGEDDEPLTYDIVDFIHSADPAPCHIVDLSDQTETAVSLEQPKFEMQERAELTPLQKRKVSDPKSWKISARLMTLGGKRLICREMANMLCPNVC